MFKLVEKTTAPSLLVATINAPGRKSVAVTFHEVDGRFFWECQLSEEVIAGSIDTFITRQNALVDAMKNAPALAQATGWRSFDGLS